MGNMKRMIWFTVLFSFLMIGQLQQSDISQEMSTYDDTSISSFHGELGINAVEMHAHSNLPVHQQETVHFPAVLTMAGQGIADFDLSRSFPIVSYTKDTTGFLIARKCQSDYLSYS